MSEAAKGVDMTSEKLLPPDIIEEVRKRSDGTITTNKYMRGKLLGKVS
jgi:hypothetical protein